MVDFQKYKYIGFPFEAFGWPGPIKQRLVGSNDGLNWDVLKEYDWGWRDTDMMKIGNRYYICATDDCVHYTDDFETFTQIPVKSGYAMSWAPEWFKDSDGTIYMFYAASNSTGVYFKMFCRTFDPQTLTWGKPEEVAFENNNSSRIDPNVHLINGKYYMWIANQQTHNVELYVSDKLKGTYKQVQTNMPERIAQAGFNRNEAPEMININGIYYLYTDPWTDGVTDENKRMLYRASSADMINWSSMVKCNCSFGMRHFTPLYIGSDSNNDVPREPISIDIEMWDGNPGTLETTNQHNFTVIQRLVDHINQLSQTNPWLDEYNVIFDLQLLPLLNRNARVQFLSNASKLEKLMPELMEDVLLIAGIIDYEYKTPVIPTVLYFDKTLWNNYWQTVADDLGLVVNAINKLTGGAINEQ